MDAAGMVITVVGIALYFYGREKNVKLQRFSYFLIGLGVGILAAVIYGYLVIRSLFG